ncbi:MAG: signal peptide peptidase SppA [Bdellovibrionota bacterium]|jgi:protease-4
MKNYLIWLAKVLTLCFIFLFIPIFLLGVLITSLGGVRSSEPVFSPLDKVVAVVELKGAITSSKDIVAELHKQVNNPKIKGIVLRIDSPGGAVAPSQDIYRTVEKLKAKKPIVASMGSTAGSGALYSALGASKVFCQPGTITGSIGVIMQMPNVRKITDQVGFEMVTIKSGEFKDTGNIFREMTDSERALLSETILDIRKDFVQAVVDGRKLKRDDVEAFADGRIIIGSKALELGLVDKFGDVYDAAREVFEILKEPLPEGEYPKLYYPEDNMKKIKKLLEGAWDVPLNALNTARVRVLYM